MRIDLSENGARRYERATVLVVPVEPQPVCVDAADDQWCWPRLADRYVSRDHLRRGLELSAPVRPGDILDVAEPFEILSFGANCAQIRYSNGDMKIISDSELPNCCGPILGVAPASSIRHHPRVVSVTAKMLGEMTDAECKATGVNGGCLTCGHDDPCDCCNPRPDYRESFIYDWTADHGEWQPERHVWVIGIEKGAN